MKTILYQPLFINPQAYFVFPQLYHIWYIPGTPEPEQPDWFKESIVAWYSPYCKQKLTNYDVIEAYVEDFTKWAYRDSNRPIMYLVQLNQTS